MKYINLFETQAAYDAAEKYYPNVSYIEATDEVVYQENNPTHDYSKDYLTFEALESGTFTLNIGANLNSSYMTSISYSTDDGTTWVDTTIDATAQTITTPTIAQGGKVLWKGVGNQMFYDWNNKCQFSSTGTFNASGNIMSLLYGDNFADKTSFITNEKAFTQLFQETSLVNAKNLVLPATNLNAWCYRQMFYGCTALTTAPSILPATTLAENCCNRMFKDCTSLTTAPELPATTLTENCYDSMFYGCTNLNSITMLATNIYASNCLRDWVQNVAANGTFTKAAEMTTLETGYSGIPSGWTVVDDR